MAASNLIQIIDFFIVALQRIFTMILAIGNKSHLYLCPADVRSCMVSICLVYLFWEHCIVNRGFYVH
jgi:hypothetical protein